MRAGAGWNSKIKDTGVHAGQRAMSLLTIPLAGIPFSMGVPAALLSHSDLVIGQPILPDRRAMWRLTWRVHTAIVVAIATAGGAYGQRALTWEDVRHRFEDTNPTLRAARIGIDEAKAQEVTASLRPNPDLTTTIDQLDPFTANPYRPLANAFPLMSGSSPWTLTMISDLSFFATSATLSVPVKWVGEVMTAFPPKDFTASAIL